MKHRVWRSIISSVGVGLLVVGAAAISAPASASPIVQPRAALAAGQTEVNPLTIAGGFTVYTHGDTNLGNSEFEGSLAVGGELTVSQPASYQFAHVIAGTGGYVLPTIDGDPTRLLVGSYNDDPASNPGRVQISNSGATEPAQIGDLKVVDRTAPFVSYSRGGFLRYGLTDGTDDPPLIDAESQLYPDDSTPPTSSAGNGSIFTHDTGADTSSVVASYVEADEAADRDQIAQCFADVVGPDSLIGYHVPIIENDGDRIVLGTLSPDQPNVINYDDIAGSRQLQFSDGTPGPHNPLIIHVSAGTTAITPVEIDPEGPYSPYVVWDMSQVSGPVTIATGGRGDGSIYAPDADLQIAAEPWDGQIVSNSLHIIGGEVHSYLFAGALPCDSPTNSGTFSVAKALDGVTAAELSAGTTFRARYVARTPDGTVSTGVLVLNPDGTPASPTSSFPYGTKIAVVEVPPSGTVLPPGFAWSGVSWSGDNTFTIDATHPNVALQVTNTAAAIPAGFSITKAIAGSGATSVASGEEFTVQYQVNDGTPIDLTVSPGDPVAVNDLTAGDTVTISEVDFPEVDGVTWGTPTWTIDGVEVIPAPDGSVSFTVKGGESVALELTNVANADGGITVSKTLAGDGADALPAGSTFPLIYTIDGGAESTVSIPADKTVTIDGLSAGTVVTVREGALPEIPGVEWGTAGWTVNGVPTTPDADGNITFVVSPGTNVNIALVNTANGFGTITGEKTVTGDAASLVPSDTAYTVEYRVSNGPVKTAQVTAGTPVTVTNLPTGVVVNLREQTPPAIPGVVWGDPTWTVDGAPVTPDADGWITLVPETGTTVAFTLNNHADPAPTAGAFSVTKSVTGSGASLVPSDTPFTVHYSVDGGADVALSVTAGKVSTVTDVPVGSTVTFSEVDLPDIDGVDWGKPSWTIDGKSTSDPTITVAADQTIAVGLANTATAPAPDDLADTGSNAGALAKWAALLMALGFAIFAAERISRRRNV